MPEPHAMGGRPAAAGLLAGRLLLAFIFVHEGWSTIGSYSGAAAYMQRFGVPVMLLPAVIALEFGGGLLIVGAGLHGCLALCPPIEPVYDHWLQARCASSSRNLRLTSA